MGELTERLKSRAAQKTHVSNKELEESLPKVDFTTITGRRIRVSKMMERHDRRVLQAAKGVEGRTGHTAKRQEDWGFLPWMIDSLVEQVYPDNSTEKIDYNSLSIGEETDLLYLIRMASHGRGLYFDWRCPICTKKHVDSYVDTAYMKRSLLLPHDMDHAAWVLCKYDPLKDIPEDQLTVDWSDLGSDYHEQVIPLIHGVDLGHTPDTNHHVVGHLAKVVDKRVIGEWAKAEDPTIIRKSLSRMIDSIGDEKYVDDNGFFKVSKEKELLNKLGRMTTYDCLYLRDQIQDQEIGIDNVIDLRCSPESEDGCARVSEHPVRMDAPFFLPKRVHKKSSSKYSPN